MKLIMLGTGHAVVTKCYNTCFVLNDNNNHFLVDGGGGSTLLKQLDLAGVDWREVKDIFVTHKHIDHLLGIMWMIRLICQSMNQGKYKGEARIYGHNEVTEILKKMADMLLEEKETRFIGKSLHLVTVEDGQEKEIIGHKILFFDIHSTKAKQFGFSLYLNDEDKLTCCGDEPYNELEKKYVYGSKWLMHEAFCLYAEADIFKPYEKHHSTAKDASELAEQLDVKNLILYHTEDKNIAVRNKLYTEEGKKYYSGNLYVPEDLEVLEL